MNSEDCQQHQLMELTEVIPSYVEEELERPRRLEDDIRECMDEQERAPKQIEHKVQLGDTLEGISLQYGVPIATIRQYNGLDSDQIFFLKTLLIPNPRYKFSQEPISQEEEDRVRKQMLANGFMNELRREDKNEHIARYYLEEANWSIEKAAQLYKQDLLWEKKQKEQESSHESLEQSFSKQFKKILKPRVFSNAESVPIEVQMREKKGI